MFCNIHVRGRGCPWEDLDCMILEPCLSMSRCVLWVIVLLEYDVGNLEIMIIKGREEGFSEDVAVLDCIEVSTDVMKPASAILCKATPYLRLSTLCLTFFCTFLSKNSSPGFLWQYILPSEPKRLNFDSSVKTTHCQSSSDQPLCSFALIFLFFMWIFDNRGFFQWMRPCSPRQHSMQQVVEGVTWLKYSLWRWVAT